MWWHIHPPLLPMKLRSGFDTRFPWLVKCKYCCREGGMCCTHREAMESHGINLCGPYYCGPDDLQLFPTNGRCYVLADPSRDSQTTPCVVCGIAWYTDPMLLTRQPWRSYYCGQCNLDRTLCQAHRSIMEGCGVTARSSQGPIAPENRRSHQWGLCYTYGDDRRCINCNKEWPAKQIDAKARCIDMNTLD